MNEVTAGMLFAAGLFAGMLGLLEVGRRVRRRQRETRRAVRGRARGGRRRGVGVDGTPGRVHLLRSGFALRGPAPALVDEANAIGTAYVRLDLLPSAPRQALQQLFGTMSTRAWRSIGPSPTRSRSMQQWPKPPGLQQEIWQEAVAATQMHPPRIIFGLLGAVSLVCALLAGYGMGESETRSWLHVVGFAAVLAVTIYVIIDLEYPRLGLFQVAEFDQLLVDLRATMR